MKSPWTGPDALEEKIVGIFVIVFASLCFAVLLVFVSTLYAQLTTAGAVKRDAISNIVRFTNDRGIPKASEYKLLEYFDALYTVTDGQDDVQVLSQLPYQLRLEIVLDIYKDTLCQAPLFGKISEECGAHLAISMRPQVCLEGDAFVVPGMVFDELVFLMRGSLRVSGEQERDTDRGSGETPAGGRKKSKLERQEGKTARRGTTAFTMIERLGTSIGGMSLFGKPPRAPYRITANKKCNLCRIPCGAVMPVLNMFPTEKATVIAYLEGEHKTLFEASMGGAKRRVSNVGTLPEKGTKPGESSPAPDAAAAGAPALPAPGNMTAAEFSTRLSALETTMTSCNDAVLEMRKNVAAMPAIIKVLKTASVNAIAS